MTITTDVVRTGPLSGNGVSTMFPFTFQIASVDEIEVRVNGLVVPPSLYSVMVNDSKTGTVTFNTAPVIGAVVDLYSNPSFQQQTNFETQGPFFQRDLNNPLDRAAIRALWLRGKVNAALRAPAGETVAELPAAATRAGKFLAFDAGGNAIAATGAGGDSGLRTDMALATGAGLTGFNLANTYSPGTVGAALKTAVGAGLASFTNPATAAGVAGLSPDGLGTVSNIRELTVLTGTRTGPSVGRTIEISDGQTGPASSAGVNTASNASYGLSVVGMRPSWNTSGITGEMDGITVFLRQASGDTAAHLANVGVRNGFAAFSESYTFSADPAGGVIKAINTSIGVVNARDGGEYGMNIQATSGLNLTSAYRAAQIGTSTWADWMQFVNAAGTVVARLRGADQAWFAGSYLPIADFGGDLGFAGGRFSTAYTRFNNITEQSASSVGTPAAGTQTMFIDVSDHKLKVKDASGTLATIDNIVTVSAATGAVLPSPPSALPYAVSAISGGIGTGTGGTNGTYAGGVSGGPSGFQWTYTIAGGALSSYAIINPGIATTNAAPTLSLPSGGLTSPTIPTATVATISVGRNFFAATADSLYAALWTNAAGVLTAVNGPDGLQVKAPLAGGATAGIPTIIDRVLKADRNIFDYTLVNDNQQMSAFAGAGTGGALSALAGQFVTPLMEVTAGVTYAVPFNVARGIYFNAAGSSVAAVSAVLIDSFNFTITVPTGQGILYVQLQGDKGYVAKGSLAKIDIHTGSRITAKGFELLEPVGVGEIANKARKGATAPVESLIRRSDLLRDYIYNGAGVLTASPGTQCWATGLLRCDPVRGWTSSLPIVLDNAGVSFFDLDKAFLFSNANTFTAVTTSGQPTMNVTAVTNGLPLMLGSLVTCSTAGVVPGLAATGTFYIIGVPANGAALGTYTLSGNATNTGTHTDMKCGGMAAGVTLYPPAGYGVAYGATAYFNYFNYPSSTDPSTPDRWTIIDGPMVAPTATAGASAPSLGVGLSDLELMFPWYKTPFSVLGNSINAQALNDYFAQVTKCDLQLLGAVPATQMHQFLDGCRIASSGGNRNTVTGNVGAPFAAGDFATAKGIAIGPMGGNEEGYASGAVLGQDITGQHRQPYPLGTIGQTAPVAVFQVATTSGSTTITVSGIESGVILPGSSCLFTSIAPAGLPGRYIASQTGVTSVTGATASFSGTTMTCTVAGTGSFAVGQTVSGANIPANTWIASLGTGAGGTGTYTLNNNVGTITAQATTATNAGGNGTYLLDASTGVATGGAAWTTVGTFYGTMYWLCITKLGAYAPNAIQFLITMYPRYDLTSTNGGPTDPNNPGNPINTLGIRTSDYVDATIAFGRKYHFPVIDMFYNTPFSVNNTVAMLATDLLHPRALRPPTGLDDQGVHVYAGRVARVVNQFTPVFA